MGTCTSSSLWYKPVAFRTHTDFLQWLSSTHALQNLHAREANFYLRITPITLFGYVPKFSSSSVYCPVFLSRFKSTLQAEMNVPLPFPFSSRMISMIPNG